MWTIIRDIVAVVLDIHPKKQIQTKSGGSIVQEFVLIDQELKPRTLTMWDQFVDNEATVILDETNHFPVIFGMHLKVVSYNEISLSTKSCSSFLINPDIPESVYIHGSQTTKIFSKK